MRAIVLCFGLVLAIPASANSLDSLEEAACRTPRQSVEQMANSEKLCRSFVRALTNLPQETSEQAQALLTPESLALMAATTAVWLGSQAVPVVGQAVDAALISLGVILLAVQASEVTHALWSYVNLALGARSELDLNAAARHLSRALATVGLNVVAFILMKKAAMERPRPPPQNQMQLATREGLLLPAAAAPASTTVPASTAVASAGRGAKGAPRAVIASGKMAKVLDLKAFAAWLKQAKRQPVRGNSKALRFQVEHGGPDEILAVGGGERVWADGANLLNGRLREIKHIDTPDRSPYIPGSNCNEEIRELIREQTLEQFQRYAAVIRDEATPAMALEVITNDARAIPFFELLLREVGLVGEVIVK